MGATPASVLNEARIEYGKRLLADTDDSVLSVALASGYQSVSAFHRRFRLATGVTPAEYRATARGVDPYVGPRRRNPSP
jgi:AraC-like DNA-binding protein